MDLIWRALKLDFLSFSPKYKEQGRKNTVPQISKESNENFLNVVHHF